MNNVGIPDGGTVVAPPEGELLIIEYPNKLSAEQAQRIREHLDIAKLGRKVLILDGGAKVSTVAQLERIEAKLDKVLSYFEDEQDEVMDLEGVTSSRARDESKPL